MFSLPLLVLVGLVASVSSKVCDDYWTTYNGHCYRYFALDKEWQSADNYCNKFGAHLVGINSRGENDFVSYLIAGPQNTGEGKDSWIGLNDIDQEGSWRQADRSSSGYHHWRGGEPNNKGNEDCVETNHGGRGQWNDQDCNTKQHFVCED